MSEFLERLESEEGQKVINKIVEDFKREEQLKKELVSSDSYFKWLEEFAKKYPSFADDDWLYCPEEISEEDNEKVHLLSTFFSAIDSFARSNYIFQTPCDFGGYYSVKYNGKVYEIGCIVGQGTVCFCNTKDVSEVDNVICFEEIANTPSEILVRTSTIENLLGGIEDLFKELSDKGVPFEAIVNEAEAVLKKMQNNN